MSFRWTKARRQTLRSALNNAWDERESFSDAYGHQGPEAERAQECMAAYEALSIDFLGEELATVRQRRAWSQAPSVSIHELAKGKKP